MKPTAIGGGKTREANSAEVSLAGRNALFFPHVIHIDIAGKCNLKCKHCRATWQGRELSVETWKQCLSPIIDCSHDTVKWITLGGGEPLLYPGLSRFIGFISDSGINTLLTTNGTLLTDQHMENLLKHGLTRAQISLDSPYLEPHDYIRGDGTYEKAIAAANLCHAFGLDFSVRMTLNRLNFLHVEEFVALAKKLGAFEVGLRRFIPIGFGAQNESLLDFPHVQYKNILETLPTLAEKYQIRIYSGDPLALVADPHFKKELQQLPQASRAYAGCSIGISYLYINSQGMIRPCPMIPVNLADLTQDDFWRVWHTNSFFRKVRTRNYADCHTCRFRYSCGGCRAAAHASSGNYWGVDPTCWLGCGQLS